MDLAGTRLDIAKRLKEYTESRRNQNGTAVSAAFIKDGELVSAFVCGTQDGSPEKPVTINDLFNIGSISKLYCALAIMKLVEMEKVTLDMPIIKYLPHFTMNDERYKQITLRMCLNHSTGMPGMNLKYFASSKWLDEYHYDDFYDCFSKSKLKDNPGNATVYCNDGFILAEMVVAKVSGMSYIKFVQEYITIPIGAPSTCSGERIAENHVHIRAKGNPNEYMMNTGAGGILTDLIDCAKLGYLFIDSKNIFKPESLNEVTSSQGRSFLPDVATNFGLGWHYVDFSLEPYNFGKNTLAQSGASTLFSSFLIISRKYNLAAAISLTNDNEMIPYTVLCELCSMLLDEYGINVRKNTNEAATEVNKVNIPLEFIKKFSGMYYSNFQSFCVGFADDLLKIQFREPNGW